MLLLLQLNVLLEGVVLDLLGASLLVVDGVPLVLNQLRLGLALHNNKYYYSFQVLVDVTQSPPHTHISLIKFKNKVFTTETTSLDSTDVPVVFR
jgi:hypothetical protein